MINDYEEQSQLSEIIPTILKLVPLLLIIGLLGATSIFATTKILPAWQSYDLVQQNVTLAEDQLATREAEQENSDMITILTARNESVLEDTKAKAVDLLTEAQVSDIIGHLFQYADESGTIVDVLSTEDLVDAADTSYRIHRVQAQVRGSTSRLMNYVLRLRESLLPSVEISNVYIEPRDEYSQLYMDIQLYTSPFADGSALDNLPSYEVPAPFDPTVPQALLDPTPTPMRPTAVPAAVETQEAVVVEVDDCPGAPPTLYEVGDVVMVSFLDKGALNVLSEPRTSGNQPTSMTLAYDGEVLRLQEGPICGQWEGQDVRYWRVQRNGIGGWVGEATLTDRWLCPTDNAHCTSAEYLVPTATPAAS